MITHLQDKGPQAPQGSAGGGGRGLRGGGTQTGGRLGSLIQGAISAAGRGAAR
jgi:hypothetical protein